MSTAISSSVSGCCFKSSGGGCRSLHLPPSGLYNLATAKRLEKIHQSHIFLKFSAKYGISRVMCEQGSSQPKSASSSSSPSSPSPSSSPWKKWLLGILLTVILPAAGHKGGLFLGLKGKIDQAIKTVDRVTEVVEELAEDAEKIVEEVEEKLPDDSKLKETLESFENLAKTAVKEARKADDLVHKVKDAEEEIAASIIKVGKERAKK